MEKTISCWGSFHCKNPKFLHDSQGDHLAAKERKKESRRSRLQGPESLLRNFGADVDPNDEGWFSTNHFFTTGGPGSLVNPPGCINRNWFHLVKKHWHISWLTRSIPKKPVGEMLGIMGNFCAFGLFRSDNRRSGPTSLCHEMRAGSRDLSTLLVPYCHTAHMCWNQFWSLLFGFLPLPFTLQNMVS